MNRTSGRPLDVLCDAHVIPTLLFLLENDGCMKSEIYDKVSRGANMPRKLEAMKASGLLDLNSAVTGNTTTVHLTDVGRKVAHCLLDIDSMMAGNQ